MKKKKVYGNIANGAIYILSKKFLKLIKNKSYRDFSTEVLPKFVGRIFTYHTTQPLIDIGTKKNYKLAKKIKV